MIAFSPLPTCTACSLFCGQVLRDEALVSRLINTKYQMLGRQCVTGQAALTASGEEQNLKDCPLMVLLSFQALH